MNLFNKLFNNQNDSDKLFPESADDGIITISDNWITSIGKNGNQSCKLNMEDIRSLHIYRPENGSTYLYLITSSNNFIPITYHGFKSAFVLLANKLKFDETVFFNAVYGHARVVKEIWRTAALKYEIIMGPIFDYEKGFEIQSPQRQFILWDTTYDTLSANPHTMISMTSSGQKQLKFAYPIRLANIIFDDFRVIFRGGRTDVAVQDFYAECSHEEGNDQSFYDIRATLSRNLIKEYKLDSYETIECRQAALRFENMRLSINYNYNAASKFDAGYLTMTIENNREYPNLLIDPSYEEKILISKALIFEETLQMPANYKLNARIKRRPDVINTQFNEKAILWVDKKNNKIGFSCGQYSQVFDPAEIIEFTLQNVRPAKGSGGAYLKVSLKNEKYPAYIFWANCFYFDKYFEQIKALTGKEITLLPEDYDC